ncbi:hypothetical protein [Halobiforma nitratireducens]|uniref:Uncharacterized protein n=1 Tax=Halobiforma nitratireducens JCM 10879 TaxID=1227454 RepID=M0MKI8_9EURY|nr:hypothetical protein [Halobiforma nitratireducens]EMA46202.1 hypothetical protein C446_01548 [Halobiforma nitratireducens JCM 10879]
MPSSGDPPAVESSYTALSAASSSDRDTDTDTDTDADIDGDTDSTSTPASSSGSASCSSRGDGLTGVGSPDRPALDIARDTCAACGTTIEPTDYRLSWRFADGPASIERHYCSESCFPDSAVDGKRERDATDRTDETQQPRDWSYCR